MNKGILINFPTNIGDVILSLPLLDRIRSLYPDRPITAIVSSRTREFLEAHTFIDEVIVFDKHWPGKTKLQFAFRLRNKFDIVVDLKNSLLPFVIAPRWRTRFIRFFKPTQHITHRYLSLISKLGLPAATVRGDVRIAAEKKARWDGLNLSGAVGVGCSSQFYLKQYPYENLKQVIERLHGQYPVVILGEEKERGFYRDILGLPGVRDLVGKTTLTDVFYILKNFCRVMVAVDSSLMHMAGYLNVPVIGLFGPTAPGRSYPLSEKSVILQNTHIMCVPCDGTLCEHENICMNIDPETVIGTVRGIIDAEGA
ncbi:MAG: glycosyltransferase family 9 protein [Candidatus Omnitrophica bacterium]|nr:glycosyltransferase family 9 protein [Candidatus Omnitrophota bacterium]